MITAEFALEIWEKCQSILIALAALGIVIDLTPGIKVQPVRWLLKQIGNLMNYDMLQKIEKANSDTAEKLRRLQNDLEEHKMESWRRDILNFANDCMNKKRHTKEDFDNFFIAYGDYEKYVEKNELINGRVDLAYEYVKKIYLRRCEKNDFLVERAEEN